MFDQIDECPINDDYKQRQLDTMDLIEQLHYNHQNRIREEATQLYLEEYEETGSLKFARDAYFTHLKNYL
jgi:hypothetical protein